MIQEGRDKSLEKTTGGREKEREKISKVWRGKVTEQDGDEDLKVHHSTQEQSLGANIIPYRGYSNLYYRYLQYSQWICVLQAGK